MYETADADLALPTKNAIKVSQPEAVTADATAAVVFARKGGHGTVATLQVLGPHSIWTAMEPGVVLF